MCAQEEDFDARPTRTMLSSNDSLKTQADMEGFQGQALEEVGVSSKKTMRFSSWNVVNAIEQKYVIPGFHLKDYLRATWEGYPDDPPSPICKCGKFVGQSEEKWRQHRESGQTVDALTGIRLVHERRPIKRFELVNVWGVQGAKKSTFIAQLILELHGAYDPSLSQEEFYQKCDYCQKITITNTQELIEVGRELKEAGDSYDVLYLDDLNSIIPKQLAWKNREAYEAVFEAIGMIRRNVRVIITSAPNIEMIIGAFNRVMTFEVIVFPASKFKVERMCHDIHPYYWAKDKVTKIIIEEGRFNPYDTPHYFWKKYEERTNSQGQKGWQRSLDKLQAYEEEGTQSKAVEDAVKKVIGAGSMRDGFKDYKESGGKATRDEYEKIVRMMKEQQSKKLGVTPEPEG